MTLGTGLFLSSLLLAAVLLFIATKDRWNWKKIILWPLFSILGVCLVVGTGALIYARYSNRLVPPDSFWSLRLNMSEADVRFLKGAPTDLGPRWWLYKLEGLDPGWYRVGFNKERRVVYVSYTGRDPYNSVLGISRGDSSEALVNRLGQPSAVNETEDGLKRVYSYEKLHVFFSLAKGAVGDYGIYDPAIGPMKMKGDSEKSGD